MTVPECEKVGVAAGAIGGESVNPTVRSYVVENVIVPEASWPSSLAIVTVTSIVKGLGGGNGRAFNSALVLALTKSLPETTSRTLWYSEAVKTASVICGFVPALSNDPSASTPIRTPAGAFTVRPSTMVGTAAAVAGAANPTAIGRARAAARSTRKRFSMATNPSNLILRLLVVRERCARRFDPA